MAEVRQLSTSTVATVSLWALGLLIVFIFLRIVRRSWKDMNHKDQREFWFSLLTSAIVSFAFIGVQRVDQAAQRERDFRLTVAMQSDLSGLTTKYKNLSGMSFNSKRLDDSHLAGKSLKNAKMRHASLQGADLEGAEMQGVDLVKADLFEADLKDAQLQGADLRYAKFEQASVWSAKLDNAKVNAETCWPPAFMSKLKSIKLVRMEARTPTTILPPSPGLPCRTGEHREAGPRR
jgi:uncharacterized protein YjbI with pentapeptide repeats